MAVKNKEETKLPKVRTSKKAVSITGADFVTEEEYLKHERLATTKSEYHAGKIVAMAGAQLIHNRIVSNLIRVLGNCAIEHDCEVFPSDLLVHLPECKKYFYPDISVVCGEVEIAEADKSGLDVLLNPQIVIEVSSKSTAGYDLGEKMECYLKLKSLEQYIVISSEQKLVIIYTKDKKNVVTLKTHKEDEKVTIGKCKIEMKEIYNKVGFEQ